MQEKKFNSICECLSKQRLGRYRYKTIHPLDLYRWNISLSETFYPLLNTVEVALRNKLHTEIGKLLDHSEWLSERNEKILDRLHEHWISKLDNTLAALKKKNKLDEGHVISETNFGFWTILLGNQFENQQLLWPKLKNAVFPYAKGVQINEIRKYFVEIRNLRNRVFHYEAIWYWDNLQTKHDLIIESIKWMSPELLSIIDTDRFSKIYRNGPIHTEKQNIIAEQYEIA